MKRGGRAAGAVRLDGVAEAREAPGHTGFGASIRPTPPRSPATPRQHGRRKASRRTWRISSGAKRPRDAPGDAPERVTVAPRRREPRRSEFFAEFGGGRHAAAARREADGGRPVMLSIPRLGRAQFLHQEWQHRAVRLRRPGAHRRLLPRPRPDRRPGQRQPGRRRRSTTPSVRWPGSFGSAFSDFVVPRVILFPQRTHAPRPRQPVDFISAPGVAGVYPEGRAQRLALFSFDRERARFRLRSTHAGQSVEDIRAATRRLRRARAGRATSGTRHGDAARPRPPLQRPTHSSPR